MQIKYSKALLLHKQQKNKKMENNFIQNLGLSEKELGTYTGTNAFGNFENSIASFSPVDGKKLLMLPLPLRQIIKKL